LRNYRDNILTRSKSGIKYIKLYYQHAPEVTSLLIKDRELRKEAKELLNYLIPEIKLILKSKKIELLNSKLKNKIINFLNQVQGKANPELEAAIEKLMNDIENEKNKN
jgi:competence CoiA-like predicted nuclease